MRRRFINMTIDELMEGKQPGEIKITQDDFVDIYFQPYYKVGMCWYGKLGSGVRLGEGFFDTYIYWRLYEEPKLIRYKYAVLKRKDWVETTKFYTDDEASLFVSDSRIKLEYTRTEFDV
jgi:hypothetical protein